MARKVEGIDAGRDRTLWWFLAGAALVSLLFYRDFVFYPSRLIFGTDMLLEAIPLRRFFVDEIQAGRGVPLWTPHIYGGMPFVAQLPGPIFYPSTLLYFIMPMYRAIGWTFVLHTFLSGALAYFLARSFRLRPTSAVVCGVSFMLTGYVTSHLYGGHDGRMFGMTLIPLAFGFLERGLSGGEARWFGGLAIVIAMQTFTPHTQVMYFSSLALSLFLVFHLLFRVPRGEASGWGAYGRPIISFSLAVAASVAIAGPQLFPTLGVLESVTRAATEQGYEFAASYGLPPQELSALFLPDLISSLPGKYWGQNPIKLHTEYLGAVPLALALLGVAAGLRRGLHPAQRRVIAFLGLACVLGIMFALGSATPVHRVAYAVLPLIKSLRAPAMMLGPVCVFVALLAAYGWEAAVVRGESDDPSSSSSSGAASRAVLALLAAPIVLLGVSAALSPGALTNFALFSWYPAGWPRQPSAELLPALRWNGLFLLGGFAVAWGAAYAVSRRKVGEIVLVGVLLFATADQWRVGARYLEVRDAATELEADALLSRLANDAAPGERVWAPDLPGTVRNYRPNRFMSYGVSSATGHQKFILDPYAELVGGIRPDEGLLRDPALVGLLNVRYLITPGPQAGLEPLEQVGGRYLYRIPAQGHAFFPARVSVVADSAQALSRARSNPDLLASAVVLAQPGATDPAAGRGSASIARYEPDVIELDVSAEVGGLLVVSEIYDPGWRATIDDVETRIWRTNAAFRGVEVPAGAHRLRFEYRSRSFVWGAWASVLTLAAIGALLALSWRRSSRGQPADG